MTLTKLEEIRTLSLLTERPHLIDDTEKYVAFGGYIFPWASFVALFMWAICGRNMYSKIWHSDVNVDCIKNLNPHDNNLVALSNHSVGNYISNKMRELLRGLKPEEIESMVDIMIEQSLVQH